MKKITSLLIAVVAVLVVAGGAQAGDMELADVSAHNFDFGMPCLSDLRCHTCDIDVAIAREFDTVRITNRNTAVVTAVSDSQAISGVNRVVNRGNYTDLDIDTKSSRAYTGASTRVNTNTARVDVEDRVIAHNFGPGPHSVDIAYASSRDLVELLSVNNATVRHVASSVAVSGDNYIENHGNGCDYCGLRSDCEDSCPKLCYESEDLEIDIDTGTSTAIVDSDVTVNTNVALIDTGDVVSASNAGRGIDVAIATERDTVSVTNHNNATVNVTATSGAASGQNTVKNYGDFADVEIDTDNASATVVSDVVVNTNSTTIGCGNACGG